MAENRARALKLGLSQVSSFEDALKIYNALFPYGDLLRDLYSRPDFSAETLLSKQRMDILEAGQKAGLLRDEHIAEALHYALAMDDLRLANEIAAKFPLTSRPVRAVVGNMMGRKEWIHVDTLSKLAADVDKKFPSTSATEQPAQASAERLIENLIGDDEFVRLRGFFSLNATRGAIENAPQKYPAGSLERVEKLMKRARNALKQIEPARGLDAVFWVVLNLPRSQGLDTVIIWDLEDVITTDISAFAGSGVGVVLKYPLLAASVNNIPSRLGYRERTDEDWMEKFETQLHKFAALVENYKGKYGLARDESDFRFYRDGIAYISEMDFGKEGQRLLEAYTEWRKRESSRTPEEKAFEDRMDIDNALMADVRAGKVGEMKALVERFAPGEFGSTEFFEKHGARAFDVWAAFREAILHDHAKSATWLADHLYGVDKSQVRKLWGELTDEENEAENEAAVKWYEKRFAAYLA